MKNVKYTNNKTPKISRKDPYAWVADMMGHEAKARNDRECEANFQEDMKRFNQFLSRFEWVDKGWTKSIKTNPSPKYWSKLVHYHMDHCYNIFLEIEYKYNWYTGMKIFIPADGGGRTESWKSGLNRLNSDMNKLNKYFSARNLEQNKLKQAA